ncbi:hypothetical protein [Crocosphaera chwakensis]|uniref:Transporter n=1 Tax=Crocosphaera chwakensis CCY0110 TaxID=391612 RepID=A3IWR3_9CHRO|nr:hypothetical protein [Crocosphaera chwakensis]EAZ89068.1 hypothetical protein CY0110_08656 [Crocosphaera chwakensis CCY0110]
MKIGVKRGYCWLVTAVSLICLDTYLSPVKAEISQEKQEINKVSFNYETLTNTWNYQDLQKKINQEKARELLVSNLNWLDSSYLFLNKQIKPDDRKQKYEISSNYTFVKFRNFTDDKKEATQLSNIQKKSAKKFVNSFDKKLQGNTDFLLADEPLPPSQQGIFWNPARPDSHAPIAVMGEHIHSEGEIMVSYRYMLMEMEGSRVGTDDVSDEKILEQYPVTPTRMTMQMHMFGMMYGITNNLTLMAMLPYVVKDMDHITRMNTGFNTDSEGIGDIKVTGLYQVLNENRQRIHFNAGVSFPTGSIEARDRTPAGPDQLLPYPMQLGSGTLDLHPGITYLGQTDEWSWGSQIIGTLRLGTNSNSYKFGDEIMLTAWGARKWSDWASTSLRIKGKNWGNISGKDTRLNPNIVPTADPTRRGGTQIDIGFGLNLFVPEGDLRSGRLAIEFELPIYRALQGPQLETDWQLTAGLQFSF